MKVFATALTAAVASFGAGPARRALAFAAVVILAACGDGDPTGADERGSIRGAVIDDSDAIVANAAVELSGGAQAARTTSTGSDGVYTFADVPPGTYTLTVTPPSGFTVGAAGTTSVTVQRAQVFASALVLDRVILNGSITGIVIDVDAAGGVANAAVALTGNGQADRTTTTDADGIYTFADLSPGPYALALTPPTGFSVRGLSTASITVLEGVHANASSFAVAHDSCGVARPDFGGAASAEERALFAYNVDAPLNLETTVISTTDGVEVNHITYTSPDGGLVPGILVAPIGRTGLRPGIVILHPGAMSAEMMTPYATMLALQGAVVIAIDAPALRRGGTTIPLHTPQDSAEQVQLIKDLQRAVDVLIARTDVDESRIGFEGYSYGGILGAQFVGIEQRLKTAVLAAAHGGHVTGATTPVNTQWLKTNLTCAERNVWFRAMVPIEPIRFMPYASATVLFQIGELDSVVLAADAEALAAVAPEPKDVRIYDAGHGLNQQAIEERFQWWHEQLGLDP